MVVPRVTCIRVAIPLNSKANRTGCIGIADIDIGDTNVMIVPGDIIEHIDQYKLIHPKGLNCIDIYLSSTAIYSDQKGEDITEVDLVGEVDNQLVVLHGGFGVI